MVKIIIILSLDEKFDIGHFENLLTKYKQSLDMLFFALN